MYETKICLKDLRFYLKMAFIAMQQRMFAVFVWMFMWVCVTMCVRVCVCVCTVEREGATMTEHGGDSPNQWHIWTLLTYSSISGMTTNVFFFFSKLPKFCVCVENLTIILAKQHTHFQTYMDEPTIHIHNEDFFVGGRDLDLHIVGGLHISRNRCWKHPG